MYKENKIKNYLSRKNTRPAEYTAHE